MQTSRFGVRQVSEAAVPGSFEVFDRATGAAVASGMRRAEAEGEARRRNQDTSGATPMTLRLGPPEVSALRQAIDAYMTFEGLGRRDHRILEDLYTLFSSWERGGSEGGGSSERRSSVDGGGSSKRGSSAERRGARETGSSGERRGAREWGGGG